MQRMTNHEGSPRPAIGCAPSARAGMGLVVSGGSAASTSAASLFTAFAASASSGGFGAATVASGSASANRNAGQFASGAVRTYGAVTASSLASTAASAAASMAAVSDRFTLAPV